MSEQSQVEQKLDDNQIEIVGTEDNGKVVLPNGGELTYSRNKESKLYIDKLQLLVKSLKNEPCLPTEIFYPNQDKEALSLTRKYITGIRDIMNTVAKYGSYTDLASYSFRLPHFLFLHDWQNVVVRLQFASSLKIILDTLNSNLSSEAKSKWGVLELNEEGKYTINEELITEGTLIDVFTVDEKVLSKVVFSNHTILNCKEIDGHASPVFHLTSEQMRNLSSEDLEKRRHGAVKEGEHLMGVDAWSFLQGLLYRKSTDDEEVIDIQTDILTKLDYDPLIKLSEYQSLGSKLSEEELPYGLNLNLLGCLRDYYSKDVKVFSLFRDRVHALYKNQLAFRKTLSEEPFIKQLPNKNFTITSIYDLLRLMEGNSKVLRLKLVMFDGTLVDAVTINRSLTLPTLGSFNRFNPQMVLFNKIEYRGKRKPATGFMERFNQVIKGTKSEGLNKDDFYLVDEVITSDEVIGYINSETKAYYFAEDSSIELDDKFAMYHNLNKKFKKIRRESV